MDDDVGEAVKRSIAKNVAGIMIVESDRVDPYMIVAFAGKKLKTKV